MKFHYLATAALIVLTTATAHGAAGDQLNIVNGYTSNVTSYDSLVYGGGGVQASGIVYDAGSNRFRPVVSTYTNTLGTPVHHVLTNLSQDAIGTAIGHDSWEIGRWYLAVATPTSIEIYFSLGNPSSWQHTHTYSFPNGVSGPVSGHAATFYGGWVVAASARQTAGGAVKGVLMWADISGEPLSGFGTSGIQWITGGTGTTRITSARNCGDFYFPRVCAVGRTSDTGGSLEAFAVKVDGTGAYDTTFDGDGKKRFAFGVSGRPNNLGRAMFVDAGGKWWMLANVCDTALAVCDQAMARLTSTGAFDTTFSGDGKNSFDVGGYSASAVGLLQVGTRTYFSGQVFTSSTFSNANSFLFAITSGGNADTSYGTGGLRTFNNYTGTGIEGYTGLATGSDGTANRLYVSGDRDTASGTVNGVVARHAL